MVAKSPYIPNPALLINRSTDSLLFRTDHIEFMSGVGLGEVQRLRFDLNGVDFPEALFSRL